MDQSIRRPPTRRTVAVVVASVVYVCLAAAIMVGFPQDFGANRPYVAGAIALLPLLGWVALKYPLVFPFGLYVALLPFDSLLQVSAGGATLTRFIGFFCDFALMFNILVTRPMKLPRAWYFWAALILWMALTMIWSVSPVASQGLFFTVASAFLMVTLLAAYPVRRAEFETLLTISVAAGVGAGLYGVYLYQSGQVHADAITGPARLAISTASGVRVDYNFFATSFMLPICVALSRALYGRGTLTRLVNFAALAPMIASVFLTGSRGGTIAVFLVFAYFALRSRFRVQIAAIAGFAALLSLAFPNVWQRLATANAEGGSGRSGIWEAGFKALKTYWFEGSGIGTFPVMYDKYFLSVFQPQDTFQGWSRPSHNLYVGTSVELGLVGVVLVTLAWWATFRQTKSIGPQDELFPIRIGVEALILGLFVQNQFIDTDWVKYYWIAYAMPMLVYNLHRQLSRAPAVIPSATVIAAAPAGMEPTLQPVR